ncbi:hypothetical protein BDR05DRAFT_961282 [Suillus weaverae]|nr:hypothetical protein BDR05DRAFT_961282 [Suillus weaverae]
MGIMTNVSRTLDSLGDREDHAWLNELINFISQRGRRLMNLTHRLRPEDSEQLAKTHATMALPLNKTRLLYLEAQPHNSATAESLNHIGTVVQVTIRSRNAR